MRYLQTKFIYDLLPLIPFNWIFSFKYSHLLYAIKVIRLLDTFELLDTSKFMSHIKKFYENRLKKVCEIDELANNIDLDQNKIMTVIMISYIFKTFKLVIIIFQVSYFLGIFFYIYCSIVRDIHGNDSNIEEEQFPNFIDSFLGHMNSYERAIAMTYYAFTSLSTVGFGDMYPKNDYERLLVAFILLFGVLIFSYVMGNFIEILDTFKSINAEVEDGDKLSRFFGNLKQFNKGRSIDHDMKIRIEDFMDYRWSNNKNNAITSAEDNAIMDQLPLEIQRKVYSDFLFKNFLKNFKKYFSLRNLQSPQKNSFFTW